MIQIRTKSKELLQMLYDNGIIIREEEKNVYTLMNMERDSQKDIAALYSHAAFYDFEML